MEKFLIIRFSSIGDVVLTTPIIRSLYQAYPQSEIHFLTKPSYAPILEANPYISKVHLWKDPKQTIKQLKAESFNHIFDLHQNLRSLRVKLALRKSNSSFPKENIKKYWMVTFKKKTPSLAHIVDRYAESLSPFHLSLDQKGLDFFLPDSAIEEATHILSSAQWYNPHEPPLGIVLGAKHQTKRWIPDYFTTLLNQLNHPAILIGGPDAKQEAKIITTHLLVPHLNVVGKYDLMTSAAIMKHCQFIFTHDTGFMHVAAAFKKKIFSIWGNTIPEFGMTPYKSPSIILQHPNLSCRPCSKLGFNQCPKGHFKCMRELRPEHVFQAFRNRTFDE